MSESIPLPRPASTTPLDVWAVDGGVTQKRTDTVATEEPLEIRIEAGGQSQVVAVTMRTPGADFELAAGFLFTEGIVTQVDDIAGIAYCLAPDVAADQRYNIVTVTLRPGLVVDLPQLARHFHTNSACGVCGKASLEQLSLKGWRPVAPGPCLNVNLLFGLPDQLRAAQGLFDATGGLHGVAWFGTDGVLQAVREDVGRHNAVDKLVGHAFLAGQLPLTEGLMLVSGRASFEILQKAVAAGVPIVCAVSAPSSLAVAVAEEFDVTLVGFLRGQRCNVYTGAQRILLGDAARAAPP
jgi:FdhD protein